MAVTWESPSPRWLRHTQGPLELPRAAFATRRTNLPESKAIPHRKAELREGEAQSGWHLKPWVQPGLKPTSGLVNCMSQYIFLFRLSQFGLEFWRLRLKMSQPLPLIQGWAAEEPHNSTQGLAWSFPRGTSSISMALKMRASGPCTVLPATFKGSPLQRTPNPPGPPGQCLPLHLTPLSPGPLAPAAEPCRLGGGL